MFTTEGSGSGMASSFSSGCRTTLMPHSGVVGSSEDIFTVVRTTLDDGDTTHTTCTGHPTKDHSPSRRDPTIEKSGHPRTKFNGEHHSAFTSKVRKKFGGGPHFILSAKEFYSFSPHFLFRAHHFSCLHLDSGFVNEPLYSFDSFTSSSLQVFPF